MTKHSVQKKDLRNFSLIWAFIFTVVGLLPLLHGDSARIWSLGTALAFAVVAFSFPFLLSGFYRVWIAFGEFIGGIVSKVILIVLFYGLFTPVALFLRVMGKDLLGKKLDKTSTTYWIKREKQPGSLKNQF